MFSERHEIRGGARHPLRVSRSGVRSPLRETGRLCPSWPHRMWMVLWVSVFWVATTVPHFGTLWHSHGGGDTSHQHPNLTTLSGGRRPLPSPQHPHVAHQTPQALPFGGYYAHPEAPPAHHARREDAPTQFYYETWAHTDFHWHLYDVSLPSLSRVTLWFGWFLYACFLIVDVPLSYRPKPLSYRQPRAPPVALKSPDECVF